MFVIIGPIYYGLKETETSGLNGQESISYSIVNLVSV